MPVASGHRVTLMWVTPWFGGPALPAGEKLVHGLLAALRAGYLGSPAVPGGCGSFRPAPCSAGQCRAGGASRSPGFLGSRGAFHFPAHAGPCRRAPDQPLSGCLRELYSAGVGTHRSVTVPGSLGTQKVAGAHPHPAGYLRCSPAFFAAPATAHELEPGADPAASWFVRSYNGAGRFPRLC